MSFGVNSDTCLADLPHGSYRAFIDPPKPTSLFERYEGHWRNDGRLYSITATSPAIDSPEAAESLYQRVLEAIDNQFGYVFRSVERVDPFKLWEAVRLNAYRWMVTWSGAQERDVDMQGYLCVIANLLAEPGNRFKVEVSFDFDLQNPSANSQMLNFDALALSGNS